MRDTAYATEIATASVTLGDGSEARLERIYVKVGIPVKVNANSGGKPNGVPE